MTGIDAKLDRIERKLSALIGERKKAQWVKVSFVLSATGWTKRKLYDARQQGIVRYEKRADGWWYDINSINPLFISK